MAISRKPILANHANAEALTPHDRNKTDEELVAVAATGDAIGGHADQALSRH